MKCPYCGHENPKDAKNCERCFASVPHDKPKGNKTVIADKKKNKG